jgi:hypothetical protein
VAITDNADPMHVVVYRRAATVTAPRRVCAEPVFDPGASATDQSLVATPTAIVAENNFGYTGPAATENGRTTTPGLQRVDVDATGCHTVWRSAETAPSVVPKLSLGAGLLYTYTKDARTDGQDAWYLTAIDFRTGRTVFKRLGGEGLGFNNNFAPITLGPDGTAYLGVLGGIVSWRDRGGSLAGSPARPGGRGAHRRARLRLRVSCARPRPMARRARVRGADVRRVRRVLFRKGGRTFARDARRPFTAKVRRTHARRFAAIVRMRDGRRVKLKARVPRCVTS